MIDIEHKTEQRDIGFAIVPETLANQDTGAFEFVREQFTKLGSVTLSMDLTYRRAGTMRDSHYVCVNYEAVSRLLTLAEMVCTTDNGVITAIDETVYVYCATLLDTARIQSVFETSRKISHVDFKIKFRKIVCGTKKKPYTKYTFSIIRSVRVGGHTYDGLDVHYRQTIATTINDHHRDHTLPDGDVSESVSD